MEERQPRKTKRDLNAAKIVLKFPVLIHRLYGPLELLAQALGEELLDGNIVFLREDYGETRINVVLKLTSR